MTLSELVYTIVQFMHWLPGVSVGNEIQLPSHNNVRSRTKHKQMVHNTILLHKETRKDKALLLLSSHRVSQLIIVAMVFPFTTH